MALSSSSFRHAGFALATLGGLSVLAAFPAAAQQVNAVKYNGSPACAPYAGTDRAVKCEIEQINLRTQNAKRRGSEADRQNEQNLVVINCVNFLTAGVKDGRFVKTEILEKAGGKLNDVNACTVAKMYGYGRKADATSPAPR